VSNTSHLVTHQRNIDSPALRDKISNLSIIKTLYLSINDDEEDEESGQEVVKIGRTSSVEGLVKGVELILLGGDEMEQSDNGTFELGAGFGFNGDGTESSPENVFADIGGDEEGDTRAQTVAFLHHFIEENDDNTGEDELEDDEKGISDSQVFNVTVDTRPDISESFTDTDNQ